MKSCELKKGARKAYWWEVAMFEKLLKFGLQHHDLSTMLWNVAFMLRLLALNVDGRHKKRIPIFIYLFTLTSIVCYAYVFVVSAFWFIFFRNVEVELVEKIIIFSLGTSSTIGVTKFAYMYWNKKKIQEMVAAFLFCDSNVVPYSRMSRSIAITLRDVKKRAMVFWVTIVGNATIYVLIPFVTPGRNLPDNKMIIWGLEPMFDSPNFEMAHVIILMCVPIVAFAAVNITAFLIVVVGFVEAQMLALSQELLNLWEDAQIDYRQKALETNHFVKLDSKQGTIVNYFVKHRLETIMKSHAINIQLVKQIEDVFKNAIAWEFALISTALIADLLGGLENTYLTIPFAIVQVAMDCFTGQKLLDANKAFETAVYHCKWENFDVSNMKLVMVMLQSAQKTLKLSAGGVTYLSYMSLMSVVRAIYQAYAALYSTMNKG